METLHDIILRHSTLTGNERLVGYPQLREAAKLSWYKLFKKTRESIVRRWVEVNDGIVVPPDSLENLLGVYIEDECGNVSPLYEDNYRNTLSKPALKCKCTSCDQDNCLCPTLQPIPIIKEVIFEDGVPRLNKSYSKVLKNGEVVIYNEDWVPSYDNAGQLIDVILIKNQLSKCSVSVSECGCIENTNTNASLLLSCGCITDYCVPYLRERYPALYNRYGYYKYDRQQCSLFIFDCSGKKSKLKQVMLVFQSSGVDMNIPDYAVPALIALIDWTRKQYSPMFNANDAESARRYFSRLKNDMLRHLHPIQFELITQARDYNAISRSHRVSYNNQNSIDMQCDHNKQEPCCPPTLNPVTNVINHTTIVNNGDSIFDFDVANDGWQEDVFPELIGKTIKIIQVDGIGRKFQTTIDPPADGRFYFDSITGRLVYRTSLNQYAWVLVTYTN